MFTSASVKPADKVNSAVVLAMKEKDSDVSNEQPKTLTFDMVKDADLIVTIGYGVQGICAGPFSIPTIDWDLEDPKGKSVEKVREIRDEIEERIKKLIQDFDNLGS